MVEVSAHVVRSRSRAADLLLLLVAVAWGSTYLVAKLLVADDTVLAMLAVRMTATALLLAVLLILLGGRLTRTTMVVGCVLGVLLSTVFLFETYGIALTSATNAGVIISLTIIITPLLESAVLGRSLGKLFYFAALIAVVGIYFLVAGGPFSTFTIGDLLVLVAAFARAVHVTMMHRLSGRRSMDSLAVTFVQMLTCAVVFLVLSSIWGVPSWTYLADMGLASIGWMAYLVVVCTVFPFFIQMWAVRRTSPTRVSLLLGTEPVFAAIIGIALAGDRLGVLGIVGIVLVLVGTMWGQRLERGASTAGRTQR